MKSLLDMNKNHHDKEKNKSLKGNHGVNVEIFAAGDGIHYPKKGHIVTIHYTAFLHNEGGEMFDSVSFAMNNVQNEIIIQILLFMINFNSESS